MATSAVRLPPLRYIPGYLHARHVAFYAPFACGATNHAHALRPLSVSQLVQRMALARHPADHATGSELFNRLQQLVLTACRITRNGLFSI